MKTPIIISISLVAILIALVLGWAVFVKTETTTPVQTPVTKNGENANATPAPSVEPTPSPDDASAPTPSPSSEIDTSDWKVYRNEKFGFELKYPKDYSFEDRTEKVSGNDPTIYPWYARTNFLLSSLVWGEVHLEILNTIEQDKIMSTGGWQSIKENGIRKSDNFDVYLYSIDLRVNNMQVILHNGKAYKFIYYIPNEENFEKIISTFKFIK